MEMESAEINRRSINESSFHIHASSFRSSISTKENDDDDDEVELQWAAIERLPTFERIRSSLFDNEHLNGSKEKEGKSVIDVTKLGAQQRHIFIEKLLKDIEQDNRRLLQKLKERIDSVGVELPTVEVRYQNLFVEAECEIVEGKPLPTLWNTLKNIICGMTQITRCKSQVKKLEILKDVSGIIKPSRLTLLLGPPGCGKTTLLQSLAGILNHSLKVTGEITYNGFKFDEFAPQKTSAYISQYDLHIPEMTVRETLDFSARCQGIGSRADMMQEVNRREKQAGIVPEPDIDTYMKAISIEGLKRTLLTDYIIKILGLDTCADTIVGNAMKRGISGGQKKRLTTGAVDLLWDFFKTHLLVVSKKDQEKYWYHKDQPYSYIEVDKIANMFNDFHVGKKLSEELSKPFNKSEYHKNALFFKLFLLLFLVHQVAVSLFRLIASMARNPSVASTCGLFTVGVIFVFGGFIIRKTSLPAWLQWGFWVCPLAYAEIGVSVNEFLAPRWQKMSSSNITVGQQVLKNRGLDFSDYFYWISIGALVGFWIVFNIAFTCALSYINGRSRTKISHRSLSNMKGTEDFTGLVTQTAIAESKRTSEKFDILY
ncbi:hypothetical protein FEM48_Zijuj04G0038300 [Ziziphus jujuba var. spinosa]|uniref:Pleiotropic drug resistance protein 3-like n=1 Tax=Ziziphus jujuba var. spinosa TaxID=714518 RepID=A0A978VHM8_ZIZJJ|nr:hypothetical protein FEM48_Zijuj04G0038300 [Ziziphus jujuba var. spinosa]